MSGKVQNASTHILCDEHAHSNRLVQGSVQGAMDEMSRKVQNASPHILRRQSHEHAHSSRSVQGPVQGGNDCKHTSSAVLSWMLQPSKLATPFLLT